MKTAFEFLVIFCAVVSSLSSTNDVSRDYKNARNVRTKHGHTAALPFYQNLLSSHNDVTAATRIAASPSSPQRHDQTCPVPIGSAEDNSDSLMAIKKLRLILQESDYDNQHIQKMFGIQQNINRGPAGEVEETFSFSKGPVYIKPVPARAQSHLPSFLKEDLDVGDKSLSSLTCLVSMFLLGFALPREMLSRRLIGADETIHLLEQLGLAYPCENDPSIIVPYVHIFPVEIDVLKSDCDVIESTRHLILITDCHPAILSQTTVGVKEDGAVMYIGPDSLALVQHKIIQTHLMDLVKRGDFKSHHCNKKQFKILDMCAGSGIQALSVLASLEKVDPTATAICVDINDRALRFTKFNALLNGLDGGRVHAIKADLISGSMLDPQDYVKCSKDINRENSLLDFLMEIGEGSTKHGIPVGPYDIILANPPFIPTPQPKQGDNVSEIISKRYGLFSSGGSSGEEVLKSIIFFAGLLLREEDGLLAVVSEFMNPPTSNNPARAEVVLNDELLEKMRSWWQVPINDCEDYTCFKKAKGILFTNESPVSSLTYAQRRADDNTEILSWMQNLEACKIKCISPGQLYIRTGSGSCEDEKLLHLRSRLVPGSIWTTSNHHAILFTRRQWETVMDQTQ